MLKTTKITKMPTSRKKSLNVFMESKQETGPKAEK